MQFLTELPLVYIIGIINVLGLPGLVLILWYVDQRRISHILESHQADMNKVLKQYRDDMHELETMYKTNVRLVEKYESLAGELATIIRLNTQALTSLVDQIKNNMFCPLVREKGPNRG